MFGQKIVSTFVFYYATKYFRNANPAQKILFSELTFGTQNKTINFDEIKIVTPINKKL